MGKQKTMLEPLNEEQKKVARDRIDDFRLQLIVEESRVNQNDFDLKNIIETITIQRKQTLKKIELHKLNIKAMERQIREGVPVPVDANKSKNLKKMEGEETEEKEKEGEKETTEDTEEKESSEEKESEDSSD